MKKYPFHVVNLKHALSGEMEFSYFRTLYQEETEETDQIICH